MSSDLYNKIKLQGEMPCMLFSSIGPSARQPLEELNQCLSTSHMIFCVCRHHLPACLYHAEFAYRFQHSGLLLIYVAVVGESV
jgi:hypothetical protein